MGINNKRIGPSLIWNFGEKLLTQGTQLVISIVLARLLLPEDYGVLALVMVFVNVLAVFVETGLGSAIVQKKELKNRDINQLFAINSFASVLLYFVLFFLAPWIASIYSNYDANLLVPVIRFYSIVLPIGAVTSIQSSILYRQFDFKKLFFVNTATVFISGAIGIAMAHLGYGVWALVIQQIASKIILFAVLLIILDWKPRYNMPDKNTLSMVRYSANILGNRLIVVLYNQFRSLLIGKIYSADDLAFYNKGETFPSMIATNTDYSLQKVMFSAYSREQDDLARIKQMMRRTITLSTYVLTPIMLGFAAAAENIVVVLITNKWLPSVTYMRLFCFIYLLQPIKTASAQALDGIGKSRTTLRIGGVAKIVGVVLLLVALRISVQAIVIATLITELLSLPLYFYISSRYIKYTIREQLMDLGKNLVPAVFVSVIVYGVGALCSFLQPIYQLLIQILSGVTVYIIFSIITHNESFQYIKDKMCALRRK